MWAKKEAIVARPKKKGKIKERKSRGKIKPPGGGEAENHRAACPQPMASAETTGEKKKMP